MSYYIVKNVKFKKKENKVSCEIADSSLTDYENKYIFSHCDDLYKGLNGADIEDKKAYFMYEIICGNFRCVAYKNLINTFTFFEEYVTEIRKAIDNKRFEDLKFIYKAFEKDINAWLINDCYVRQTNTPYYLSKKSNSRCLWLGSKCMAKSYNSKFIQNKTSLVGRGYEIEYIKEG